MNQKGSPRFTQVEAGLAPILIVLLIAAVLGGYLVYSKQRVTPTLQLPKNQQINSPLPKASTVYQKPQSTNSGIVSLEPSTGTPTPAPTNTASSNSTAQPTADLTPKPLPDEQVTASGEYTYLGQSITYSFNFPKNGGTVSGSVGGVCNGPVTGKFEGGNGGKISGKISGSCGVGILSQNIQADYSGKAYLNTDKIDINWEGNIPFFSNLGSFTLNFTP